MPAGTRPGSRADVAQAAHVDEPDCDRENDGSEYAARQILERSGEEEKHERDDPAVASCASWLRPPERSTIAVCVGLPFTTNVPLSAAAALAADRPDDIRVFVERFAMARRVGARRRRALGDDHQKARSRHRKQRQSFTPAHNGSAESAAGLPPPVR